MAANNATNPPDLSCRCLPTQPCWPPPETWQSFNEALGGRLFPTTPPARECHFPFYNRAKCRQIRKRYFDDSWRDGQPGAMMYTQWERYNNKGCLGTFGVSGQSCQQGAIPLYTVNATSVAHIQETLKFAAKHNLRLVIKNTGHDLLGRSIAPNSLSLWVHHRKKIEVFDAFIPEGAPDGTRGEPAVMVESGVQFRDLMKVMEAHKRTVVYGSSPSVGVAGGFCTGGGNGVLSRLYGLCVDNVLQYKVVTADGQHRVANAYQNQDLFWALRGGGAGTFGVVTELVMRTHPPLKNIIRGHIIIISFRTSTMDKLMRNFWSRHKQWAQEGWVGYSFNVKKVVHVLKFRYFLPNGDLAQAKASINDFIRYARSLLDAIVILNSVRSFPSIQDVFSTMVEVPAVKIVGVNLIMASRLVPRTMFDTEEGIDKLTMALKHVKEEMYQTSALTGLVTVFVDGSNVSEAEAQETSVQPSWRSAMMLPTIGVMWGDDVSPQEEIYIRNLLAKAIDWVRAITPGYGAYLNEAHPNEPDWQESFFGANYPRLLEIKHKYDPHGLFVCRKCVGSEEWGDDLMCRTTNISNITAWKTMDPIPSSSNISFSYNPFHQSSLHQCWINTPSF
ncbi:hypothetical protein BGW42_005569 [Actinomortierella wolfii]|nr:hypothetical protein BGW42_005569 [Actinomortierella wolfii]